MITTIRKRDNTIVDFDRCRIEKVIEKACVVTGISISHNFLVSITNDIVCVLEEQFSKERIPNVENVQDIVERILAERGLFDVAKQYILYRKEREKIRITEQEAMQHRVEQNQIYIIKRNGKKVRFDVQEIVHAVENCCKEYNVEYDVIQNIVEDTKRGVYDGITTHDVNKAVIMAIRGRIERDPIYSEIAARFLFNDLYKDVLGCDEFEEGFITQYRAGFKESIHKGIACGRLDEELNGFDFEKLSRALFPSRDRVFHYLGAQTLYDRYFLKDYEQNILEVPQYFWMRVAMGLVLKEKNKNDIAIQFYEVISTLRYIPSTPTLFHSGTSHPQMSSCYLTTIEDDLHHIFKSISDNAQLSKWSGGLGNDFTNVRGTGALIKTTNVGSQGVVPFLKIVDATTAAINRSGKRRGATCVYLETWHYDIEDFLELRKNTGDDRRRTHDTNTAHWIPDLFMKRVIEDGVWTLFSPHEVPDLHHIYGKKFEEQYCMYEERALNGKMKLWKQVRAKDLWRKMITMLFETGHPWITFKDPCNIRSPQDHAGVVHSSNLCTEITLNTSREETAVCNLGSVNLMMHMKDGAIDRELLEDTVRYAMRMLDNVIDLNYYPTPEAERANMRHRPVGLGIMGFQDLLYTMNLPFESDAAVDFSDEIMEFISYHAILGSSRLAEEKGKYPSYKGSKWDRGIFPIDTVRLLEDERGVGTNIDLVTRLDWDVVRASVRTYGMRNSNCCAIAPTATIANIAGCLPSIEPIYKNVYVKSNFSGEFTIINQYLVHDLKMNGLWSDTMLEKLKYYDGSVQHISEIPVVLREKYKETFEIDSSWILRHAAYRGKWIDQSQSLNIFTASKSGKVIGDTYLAAWKIGLKTTYYLRTLAASGIEKSTLDINAKYDNTATQTPSSSAPVVIGETCEACQ